MAGLKALAKDTALYGLSSIIGRLLNWLLVPLYVVKVNNYEFGEVTQLYAWTGLLLAILTYGLETGFFRFANKDEELDPKVVYSTCLTSLWATSSLFLILVLIFLNPISGSMGFEDKSNYIAMMAVITAVDALTSVPFAYLRFQKRPLRFASIKLLFVSLNIASNLFFLVACPKLIESNPELVSWCYSPERAGVYYIILSNLISTLVCLIALAPQIITIRYRFDSALWLKIMRYSMPLLILSVAGIMNQTAEKIMLPMLIENQEEAKSQLGIYGANYKFAVIMVMFIQAFRFAYEPIVFGKFRDKDNKQSYIEAMKYFIIFGLLIFLCVGMFIVFLPFIPVVKSHVDPNYFTGLAVVPIIMMAELFFGIFFNLSFWYKLTDRTKWGAYFSIGGCSVTILLNILFVPIYGYMACAWAAFTSYFLMMAASYYFGQKYYPIKYEVKNALFYIITAAILYFTGMFIPIANLWLLFAFRVLLVLIYLAIVLKKEKILPVSKKV